MTPRRPRAPGRYRAFVYAVLVHLGIVGLLVVGFRFSGGELPLTKGKPVQAVAVEDPQKRIQEEEKRQAEERRKQEEARKREAAERQRAEQARKEQEARQAEEQRRLAQKQREEAEKKRQAEAKRKQEEAQRRAEAERRKQEEAERRRAAEESLKQQIAAEERARAEAARAARAASEADKYKALIRQKVSRNWNRPAGTKSGLKCVVRVRLVPGGEVLQAQVVRSSGDPVFDRSVENAVYKAAPLPLPPDPDIFDYFREIEFLFNPEA
ncbi:MAG: cell envelope integrity protein TolA [Gammaproteobacteria bacterium]